MPDLRATRIAKQMQVNDPLLFPALATLLLTAACNNAQRQDGDLVLSSYG